MMFEDICITKRLFGFIPVRFRFSAKRQEMWAEDLMQHNGLTTAQAVYAVHKAIDEFRGVVERI